MSNPSPSSPGDNRANILLLGLLQELVVGDFLRPENSQNLPEANCGRMLVLTGHVVIGIRSRKGG